ncbi:MAG: 1-acyl-sn-glycerol-3-phosphate acyltransferase [Deltaproteobacteria bacterium]|nr:1-acyl-sn-glycerol-3-phosphate acyltransferase [Deltaproteobacteria bacterium]
MAEAEPKVLESNAALGQTLEHPAPILQAVPAPVSRVEQMSSLESWARIFAGLVWMGFSVITFSTILVLLLPFRQLRIRVSNFFGTIAGGGCAKLSGSRIHIKNHDEALKVGPAIYVSNHTSILDIMFGIWLCPYGTVGVGKKEVIYYPFFGQLFALAGHLRIDRSNKEKAVASLKTLESFVQQNKLSIFMWPEGHRSTDGRIRSFKKGIAHMAFATGLPIVPMVVKGAHHAWENRQLRLARTDIEIEFLPAVDTSSWTIENMEQRLLDLEQLFIENLPEEQLPLVANDVN